MLNRLLKNAPVYILSYFWCTSTLSLVSVHFQAYAFFCALMKSSKNVFFMLFTPFCSPTLMTISFFFYHFSCCQAICFFPSTSWPHYKVVIVKQAKKVANAYIWSCLHFCRKIANSRINLLFSQNFNLHFTIFAKSCILPFRSEMVTKCQTETNEKRRHTKIVQ